jgi:type VI secretion system protein ImpK
MTVPHIANLSQSHLLQCFQAFYYDVLRQKEKALRYGEVDVQGIDNEGYDETNKKRVDDIQYRLRSTLEEQNLIYSRLTGGINAHLFRDAQYIMVALADEIFLNVTWMGAKEWRLSLLEGIFFQTQIAGELFFKKIDALLESRDSARYELGQLYLMALSLGFRGQYRDFNDLERLQWYHNQLYTLICHHQPHLFTNPQTPMFEQCYAHTLSELPGRGLPDLRLWGICIGCVFFIYFFVSYLVWYRISSDMHQDLNMIFEHTRPVGSA